MKKNLDISILDEKKYTPQQAAKILGVSPPTVLSLINGHYKNIKQIRAIKVGKGWRIRESALIEFIKENETKPRQERAF